MKAVYYTRYGPPSVLAWKDIPKPVPGDNEILVRVHAASINSWDWDMIRGKPAIVRMWGLFRPKYKIPGCDMAGVIEAVGKNIQKFKPGDEVYGDMCESGFGAFAEYTCAKENSICLKPASMPFEDAAAIPQAGILAVQALRDIIQLKPGQTLLINGAAGAVGSFAVQLAKMYGAEVTGVDHPDKFDMMLSIGYDHVIDYTKEDFTGSGKRYDAILDVRTNRSIFTLGRALKRSGIYATVGGALNRIAGAHIFVKWWYSPLHKKQYRMVAMKANRDLPFFNELFEAGKIRPFIGSTYHLSEAEEAFRLFASGTQQGKIVFKVV